MFFIAVLLVICFCGAVAVRYYVFEPLQLGNKSMAPRYKENSWIWVCKLPQCIDKINVNETVWAKLRNQETVVRKIIGMPGDSITITDKGRVRTSRLKFKWKNENAFIESRSFYVPKQGDTLYFSQLNDVEQDYIISYLHSQGVNFVVKTTLWQGEHELSNDRIGATKIANRQVSLHEIDFLPWQDRYLIELQIRQNEPGTSPIKMKRELFLAKRKEAPKPEVLPADTSAADSTADASAVDSTADTTIHAEDSTVVTGIAAPAVDTSSISNNLESQSKPEFEIIAPLDTIIIEKDCYYLACEKGDNCLDSREIGFFNKDDILGRYAEWPTQATAKVADKVSLVLKALLIEKKRIQGIASDKLEKVKSKVIDLKKTLTEKGSEKDPEKSGEKNSTEKTEKKAGKPAARVPERIPASRIKSERESANEGTK